MRSILLAFVLGLGWPGLALAAEEPLLNIPGTNDAIAARIAPVGKLCSFGDACGAAPVAATGTGLSGEEIYGQFCTACHTAGVSGAPKLAAADWQPRVAKGMDVITQSMLNGIGAMPARGTCMNCTDEELSSALQYMLDNAQ